MNFLHEFACYLVSLSRECLCLRGEWHNWHRLSKKEHIKDRRHFFTSLWFDLGYILLLLLLLLLFTLCVLNLPREKNHFSHPRLQLNWVEFMQVQSICLQDYFFNICWTLLSHELESSDLKFWWSVLSCPPCDNQGNFTWLSKGKGETFI